MGMTESSPKKEKPTPIGIYIVVGVASALLSTHADYSASMYNVAQAVDPSFPWPQITEIWKSVVSAFVFFGTKKLVISATFDYHLTKVKNIGKEDLEMT